MIDTSTTSSPPSTVPADIASRLDKVPKIRKGLWAFGYRPIEITSHIPGNKVLGKRPVGFDWELRARQSIPESAALDTADVNSLNTGILCDGLRVVDIDVDDAKTAADARVLAEIHLGITMLRGRDGSTRCALFYAAEEGEPAKRVVAGAGGAKVEVLGRGQQVVVDGTHPDGGRYRLKELRRRDALPIVSEKQITEFLDAICSLIGADPTHASESNRPPRGVGEGNPERAALEDVAAALNLIPNSAPANWDYWTLIGMAVWASTDGSEDGFLAWEGWSTRNPSYDADATRARWEGIGNSPPTELSFGTLVHHARRVDPAFMAGRTAAQDEFEATEDAPPPPPPPRARFNFRHLGGWTGASVLCRQ